MLRKVKAMHDLDGWENPYKKCKQVWMIELEIRMEKSERQIETYIIKSQMLSMSL